MLVEFVLTEFVQAVGTVQDATAAAGNLGITQAVDFVDKLLLTAAGIHDVRVRIAETGQHGTALSVEDFHIGVKYGQRIHGTKFHKLAVLTQQIGILEGLELSHFGPFAA